MGFSIKNIPSVVTSFFKRNFEVTTVNKKLKITAAVLTAVLMIIVILDHQAFISQEFYGKWMLLAGCLLMPFFIGATIFYNVKITNRKADNILHILFLLLMPLPTMAMAECLNSVFIFKMTYLGFLGNYLIILLLYFLFYALTGSLRLPILIINPIIFGFAVAHSYIMDFRGTPFIPMDFFSITTAAGVANTYSYTLTYNVLTSSLIFIWTIIIALKIKTPNLRLYAKIATRTFTGTFFTVIMILFYGTNVFTSMGVRPDFWNQARGYHNYGFTFMFFCNTRYLFWSAPDGYDHTQLKDYVQSTIGTENNTEAEPTIKPNIICIMNESLADLSVLGEFTTNEDYMPFMRSLSENTIKGNLYVPVIGAGTSNSEFEFLTGHTTAFLPSGSNAYMLYIKNPIASIVSTLEGQGYSSFAMHPYFAAGWNRVNVYNNMGFDSFKSMEDLLDPNFLHSYADVASIPEELEVLLQQYYPDSSPLLRQYMSDSYNYKLLIEDFEARDKSKPYFAFNVTMQNHGGYTTEYNNFDEKIYLTSTSTQYEKVNRYLSLVKESDNAFKELLSYFEKVDEPTIICMFGDHHPSVEKEFIAEVMGVDSLSSLTPEQEQLRYATPFYIWANYDIEEQTYERLSANYLSTLVLKTAGVSLTDYNKYLLKLMEKLPVIDVAGYIDATGEHYTWNDGTPYLSVLNEYEKIQYNNIADSENKQIDIFYLDGYTGDEYNPPKKEDKNSKK